MSFKPATPLVLSTPVARLLVQPADTIVGGTVADITSNGHNGTYHGGVTLGTDRNTPDKNLNLDGTGYITTGIVPDGTWAGITFAAWVNLTAAGLYPIIASYSPNGTVVEFRFHDTTGKPSLVNSNNNLGAISTVSLTGAGWHRIVGTYDGTTQKVYVDKALVASSAFAGNNFTGDGSALSFGARANGTLPLTGGLDDLVVKMGTVWTQTDVNTDYDHEYDSITAPTGGVPRSAFDAGFNGGFFS